MNFNHTPGQGTRQYRRNPTFDCTLSSLFDESEDIFVTKALKPKWSPPGAIVSLSLRTHIGNIANSGPLRSQADVSSKSDSADHAFR